VGGLFLFTALRATQKDGPVAEDGAPGIGSDPTPLGDTTEHAGEQTERGTTRIDPDSSAPDRSDAADVQRPGEGDGAERLERERPQPASERLANRDR